MWDLIGYVSIALLGNVVFIWESVGESLSVMHRAGGEHIEYVAYKTVTYIYK